MDKEFDLVVCDVDGTLLDHSGEIDENVIKFAEMVKKEQIPFTLASGRTYSNLEELITLFDIQLPVIVNNGADVIEGNRSLTKKTIDKGLIEEALWEASKLEMSVYVADSFQEYVFPLDTLREQAFQLILSDSFSLQKILFADGKMNRATGRAALIEQIVQNDQLNIIQYNSQALDIMAAGVDKQRGFQFVKHYLDLKGQTLAIGNANNDIHMIKEATVGVSVSSGQPKLKAVADYVCREDTTRGVCEAVRKFLLERVPLG